MAGDMTQANFYCEQALKVQEHLLGANHPVVRAYKSLYEDYLWSNHRFVDAIRFMCAHPIKGKVSTGLIDFFGGTISQCIIRPKVDAYNRESSFERLMSQPIFILIFGVMVLFGVIAIIANFALMAEAMRDKNFKMPKLTFKEIERVILKTVFGLDGRLNLHALKEGSKDYWFWPSKKDGE
jgi:hypothetical protein